LDWGAVKELVELEKTQGIDPCGEHGEYHTLVLDCPLFRYPVEVLETEKRLGERYGYLLIKRFRLARKE
jgi:diphthamide synthase (EF-2-diphthine--ammonia ligase)